MKQQITNNKQQRGLKKVLFFLILPFVLFSMFYVLRSAQAQNQIFTAIPPQLEINVKPGEFVQKTIQFRNEGDSTVYLSVAPKDFIVTNTTGTPEFVGPQVSGRWSASSWIKATPGSFATAPGSTTDIVVSITVPIDALPGGHYAGILYEATGGAPRVGSGTGAGTGVTQVVGTLVYLTVEGPVTENALVKRFEVPGFLEFGPVKFETEILNRSDIHIKPKGQITVKNMLGQVSTVMPLEGRNIFPNASLVYQNNWETKYLFGRYQANLVAAYGSGHALQATVYFWVFPARIALAIVLVIVIIILATILLRRRRKAKELEEELEEEKPAQEKTP